MYNLHDTNNILNLNTIKDFLYFGVSQAKKNNLFYGHGTDNAWDEIYILILCSLSIPLNIGSEVYNIFLTIEEKKKFLKDCNIEFFIKFQFRILLINHIFAD